MCLTQLSQCQDWWSKIRAIFGGGLWPKILLCLLTEYLLHHLHYLSISQNFLCGRGHITPSIVSLIRLARIHNCPSPEKNS